MKSTEANHPTPSRQQIFSRATWIAILGGRKNLSKCKEVRGLGKGSGESGGDPGSASNYPHSSVIYGNWDLNREYKQ